MKKTLLILTAMLLFIGAAFAQPRMSAPEADMPKPANFLQTFATYTPQTRDVILSEGFESGALPTGWTLANTSTASPWQIVDGLYDNSTTPPTQVVWAHGGDWFATNLWSSTSTQARNAWLFSKPVTLTAGVAYDISFWLQMTGYNTERDQIEVKIGQAANAAGMTTTIYSNTSTAVSTWTKMSNTFTPTASGTYYLGFHAMTPAGLGNDIDIDDVLIEGAAPAVCDPATNLTAAHDATGNQLTWVLPAGQTNVNVYRGNIKIASNVAATTYHDTYDPTVAACYKVEVNCTAGGVSPMSNEACVTAAAGDCDPATNFNVAYAEGCSKAVLTWNEPAKGRSTVLWNNTDINTLNYGQASVWWTGGGNGRVVVDDFDVTNSWSIETITTQAFFQASAAPGPVTMGVKIYTNNGGVPGTEIYSNTALSFTTSANIYTIQLPTPFEINTPGKYWIGIFGVYNTATPTTQAEFDARLFFVYFGSTAIGEQLKAKDFAGIFGGGDWGNVAQGTGGGPVISMYFKIEGTEGSAPPPEHSFNIYRDGSLVKGGLNALTYTDQGFDATEGHTWKVAVVCPTSGESGPVSKTLEACGDDCQPATNLAVEKVGNDAKLTWSAPAKGAAPVNVTIVNEKTEFAPQPMAGTITSGSISSKIGSKLMSRVAPVDNTEIIDNNTLKGTRDVVYSEGFETAPELGLPTGWQRFTDFDPLDPEEAGEYGIWVVVSNDVNHSEPGETPGNIPGVSPYQIAYQGAKQMVLSWVAAGINAMAVSSGFELTAGAMYEISFYLKMPGYQGIEKNGLRVTIGQTPTFAGMNSATEVYNNIGFVSSHTKVTYSFVPSATGTHYLAFKDISPDEGIYIVIDEINVTGGGTATAYNIYRDGELVKANYTSTTYTDAGVNFTQDHEWCVKVACPSGEESAGICKLFEAISTCDPATNLAVAILENCTSAELTWVEPANPPTGITDWAKYCVSDDVKGTLGYSATSGADMTAAIRFTPSDLNTLGVANGQKITKVALGVGADMDKVTSMELRIWEGGTSVVTPGTLKYTQPITNYATFTPNAMNEVTLTTPFVIDASKELRIGYRLVNTSGYPIGRDAGPVVAEKGDLFFLNGSWMVTSQALQAQGWNYNFTIKAWVEGEAITLYNIYRNDVLIKENHAGISYTNTGLAENTSYTWSVAVVCGGGLESDLISKDAKTCVGVNEYAKTTFSIVPNPATSGSIKITSQTNFNTVELISFLGQTVLSQPNAGSAATIDVSNLPNGVYFVRLISEQGTSVQKFVKQ